MDLLQAALIFLILLLSIFLSITGVQVFFILRDLKKALDKLNRVLNSGEKIAEDIERPVTLASNFVTSVGSSGVKAASNTARAIGKAINRQKLSIRKKRFYKKVL